MTSLQIGLLGKFCAHCEAEQIEGLESSKVLELLCYLLLNRTRPHTRETLAGILWGENSTTQSRKYLRQALWQLQSALDHLPQAVDRRILILEPNWIHFNSDYPLSLDVDEFERAFILVQGIGGAQFRPEQAEYVQRAVQLYKGDLLEGWYQDWCCFERERFQNMYLTLLDKLASYSEAQGNYEAGLDYSTRILQYDRARERTHQQMIRLYMMAGDRAAALRQFARCAAALQEELGVEPSKQTLLLHMQIQADTFHSTVAQTAEIVPDLAARLENLWQMLTEMQTYLQSETRAIERLLHPGETNG